jgi:acyl-CoA synthetase (AMP-forming)/AMP-acid ligase II
VIGWWRPLPGDEGVRTLVGCGRVLADQKVTVVYPESLTPCPPDRVGEVWVSGPSVTRGYWGRPEETKHAFRAYLADTGEDPFLRTGDLGFLRHGELFVTGRLKDLIIVRGRNHYPQDIEQTAEQSHAALRPGGCAAFSVQADEGEQLVVVQELQRRHVSSADADEVVAAVRRAVTEHHEVEVHAVALVRTGGVPKTSSGKIRRQVTKGRLSGGYSAGRGDGYVVERRARARRRAGDRGLRSAGVHAKPRRCRSCPLGR